jgi:2-polyprenyl-3-methyl-5-hydroxy-6-metoxy-1,4-benzoquinol methylase
MEYAAKVEVARALFDKPEWYLNRWRSYINIRAETVKEFVNGETFSSVLDIGCGDGSASIGLLKPEVSLTLLDLSQSMLDAARTRVPAQFSTAVCYVNEDVTTAAFANESFDLIICLGVFAHVPNPDKLVKKIAALLKPGGVAVAENSDAFHFLSRIVNPISSIRDGFSNKPVQMHSLNLFQRDEVMKLFSSNGLELEQKFCLSLPLPGMARILSSRSLTRLLRLVFGTPAHNRCSWLSNEFIYKLRKRVGT